jgi:hypothetical protein
MIGRLHATIACWLFAAGAASADATAMCLDDDDNSAARCACATEALAAEVGAEDAGFYDMVGTRYLANRKDEQGMAESWDAAIVDTAAEAGIGSIALLTRMNAVGTAHRSAIKACR